MTIEEELAEIEAHHDLARNSIDGYRAVKDMKRLLDLVREQREKVKKLEVERSFSRSPYHEMGR